MSDVSINLQQKYTLTLCTTVPLVFGENHGNYLYSDVSVAMFASATMLTTKNKGTTTAILFLFFLTDSIVTKYNSTRAGDGYAERFIPLYAFRLCSQAWKATARGRWGGVTIRRALIKVYSLAMLMARLSQLVLISAAVW